MEQGRNADDFPQSGEKIHHHGKEQPTDEKQRLEKTVKTKISNCDR